MVVLLKLLVCCGLEVQSKHHAGTCPCAMGWLLSCSMTELVVLGSDRRLGIMMEEGDTQRGQAWLPSCQAAHEPRSATLAPHKHLFLCSGLGFELFIELGMPRTSVWHHAVRSLHSAWSSQAFIWLVNLRRHRSAPRAQRRYPPLCQGITHVAKLNRL